MKSITVNSKLEELDKVNNFVTRIVNKENTSLRLIIEEIFVNIVNYSNTDYITINIDYDENNYNVQIEFVDNGIPFNPIDKEEPEKYDSIEEAKIGGLGIHLVKNLSDSMEYEYDGENHLIIIKNVNDKQQ